MAVCRLRTNEDSKFSYLFSLLYNISVGFGDICPGELEFESRLFLIVFVYASLATFCGPVMTLASNWSSYVPGGTIALVAFTIGLGTIIFTTVEGLSHTHAVYASVITGTEREPIMLFILPSGHLTTFIAGTTIGYGDATPARDIGKVLVACYSILGIPVLGVCLDPIKKLLMRSCSIKIKKD